MNRNDEDGQAELTIPFRETRRQRLGDALLHWEDKRPGAA